MKPRGLIIACALAIAAFAAVVSTLGDIGITVDEPLDVRPGRNYVKTLLAKGPRFFEQSVSDRVYLDNKEHPPLGRWLLGIASIAGSQLGFGTDPTGVDVIAGRLAPALCFALLVGLVSAEAGRRYGRAAAFAAGFSLVALPRSFGHAHIAALDTFVTLFWTLALLSAERALCSKRPMQTLPAAGIFLGLALLTKIHGWMLIPIVAAWSLARQPPRRALAASALWAIVGIALFFACWPWLWFDPIGRFLAYAGTGVRRTPIRVEYFGKVYLDRDVPFHYPWVIFATTVPIGIHLLAVAGVIAGFSRGAADRFPRLLVFVILFWLILFSTRIPVYDGERLFLQVFPLWAILAGLGFQAIWNQLRNAPIWRSALAGLLATQPIGLVAIHPFELSYYNALAGGLRGAERLGLERTFWGDAVDPVLLRELESRVKPGETVALAPTLAPGQGLFSTTAGLREKRIIIEDEDAVSRADWVLVYRRTAYWRPDTTRLVHREPPIVLRRRQGVWLSGLWRKRAGPAPAR